MSDQREVENLAFGIRVIFALFAAIALVFYIRFFGAQNEAKYYNQLTGNNVTVWQAMHVDLVVMTCLKPEKAK